MSALLQTQAKNLEMTPIHSRSAVLILRDF